MTATPLGVGVIGCGHVSRTFHLPVLARVAGARAVAATDPDPARVQAADVPARYASPEEMLEDPDVEAVVVATPPLAHAAVARTVLDAGRHLLLEKPLTVTPEEADALLAHPARERVVTAVGFNLRFHRVVRELRAALAAGRAGTVRLVRLHCDSPTVLDDWRDSRATGGGVVWEVGSHHADLWRHLLDEEVADVRLRGDDRVALLSGRSESGAVVSTSIVGGAPPSYEVAVVGSAGTLSASLLRGGPVRWTPATGRAWGIRRRARDAATAMADLPRQAANARHGGDWRLAFVAEWEAFAASVAARRTLSPLATFEDGAAAVRLIAGALA